jgi:hypothetical protein
MCPLGDVSETQPETEFFPAPLRLLAGGLWPQPRPTCALNLASVPKPARPHKPDWSRAQCRGEGALTRCTCRRRAVCTGKAAGQHPEPHDEAGGAGGNERGKLKSDGGGNARNHARTHTDARARVSACRARVARGPAHLGARKKSEHCPARQKKGGGGSGVERGTVTVSNPVPHQCHQQVLSLRPATVAGRHPQIARCDDTLSL